LLAIILASAIQFVRLWRLSAWYSAEANQAAFWETTAWQRAQAEKWSKEMHLNAWRSAREEMAKPMYRGPEWKESLSGPEPFGAKYHESEARDSAERAAAHDRLVEYWHARQGRYRRAARRPWLPVLPDPPEPPEPK